MPRINRAPTEACENDGLAIKLDSSKTARQVGMTYEKLERRTVKDTITCNAEIAYARNRYARVTSRVPAVVHQVEKDLGSKVSAGETLAILDSVDLGVAKAEFLRLLENRVTTTAKVDRAQSFFERANRIEVRLAAVDYLKALELLAVSEKNVEREQNLVERQAGSEAALLEAQADLATTQASVNAHGKKLHLFGISKDVIAKLDWPDVESLEGRGSTSEQELLSARIELRGVEAQIEAARKRLETLGLTAEDIAHVVEKKDTSSLLRLVAPFDGTVVELTAVMGEFVDTERVLFGLADTSKMWAMIDVYPDDLTRLRTGQHVGVTIDGLRGESFHGTLSWISSHVDRRTRTIKARAEMANPEGLLLADMFGTATITIHDGTEPVIVVPKDAVQWEGCCNVVFIRHTDALFETRKVRLGQEGSDVYVVESGLEGGESVVRTGSFLLKTEILKGSIGAGCACVEGS